LLNPWKEQVTAIAPTRLAKTTERANQPLRTEKKYPKITDDNFRNWGYFLIKLSVLQTRSELAKYWNYIAIAGASYVSSVATSMQAHRGASPAAM
jgi:hypothetical protein